MLLTTNSKTETTCKHKLSISENIQHKNGTTTLTNPYQHSKKQHTHTNTTHKQKTITN